MISFWLTIYHLDGCLPMGESLVFDVDLADHFGQPDRVVGGVRMWNAEKYRVVLTDSCMT
jgi:hypothetical protein